METGKDEFNNYSFSICSQIKQQSILNLCLTSSPWQQYLRVMGVVVFRAAKQTDQPQHEPVCSITQQLLQLVSVLVSSPL